MLNGRSGNLVLLNGIEKKLYFDVTDWLARAQHQTR
jgi:hypothetical protein